MRSIRPQLLALATVFTLGAKAQFPYTWVIDGIVPGCTPGQVVTIQTLPGTTPPITQTITLSPTCAFSTVLYLSSLTSEVELSTPCMGVIVTEYASATFNFFLDTVYTSVVLDCGGSCNASFTVQQGAPWEMTTTNTSTGVTPMSFIWWMPDGSTSTDFEPSYLFTGPGTYGICLTINDAGGCTSTLCDSVLVDSTGTIYTGFWYDCLGMLFGPNTPGTPCDDGDPNTINDTWSPICGCAGTGTGTLDCLGIPGGTNLPGTVCTDSLGGGIFFTGIWDSTCVCVDTLNTIDCLGIPGGPNLPGAPCDDGNPLTVGDTWDASCICGGGSPAPCTADFWVIQAYTYDSLLGTATPIPYTLWVWNLSGGGSGSYSFFWDFGDGNTSTDAFPTHTYAGNGPYTLCLTIDDGLGCTDTFCDTVSIDSLGFYNGFTHGGGEDRSEGFTINVMQPGTTGIEEPVALGELALWPNPVNDGLTIAFVSDRSGWVDVVIIGLDGAIVRNGRVPAAQGRNEIRMSVRDVSAGLYMVRISNAHQVISQRFVKAD